MSGRLPAPTTWQRNAVFGTVAFTIALGWLGDALWAGLVDTHPLALIALNAKPRYLVLTVNSLDPWTYYLFGTFRLLCTKPLVWLIGGWYGEPAVAWAEGRSPRFGGVIRWVERHFARFGWVAIAITSNNVMCLLAGSAGFSLFWFMVLAVAGTVVRLWIFARIGDVFSDLIADVIAFVGDHRLVVMAASLAVVLTLLWWQRRSGTTQLDELHSFEEAVGTDLDGDGRIGIRPTWSVGSDHSSDLHRVVVDVDAMPVAAWSDDTPLADVPEAWGTAFALPAARVGASLRLPAPVDPTWAAGLQANVALTSTWWGGADHVELVTPAGGPVAATPAPGRALCFTGGVDSFHSLLEGGHRPSHLLYVVGFDVALDDDERIDGVLASLAAVAAETGTTPLVVRTDLLAHPRFGAVSWEHTHGAALAAVGHLLHRTIGTLVIPPSYATTRLVPWGSRPDLDPRWSVPGRLAVEHGDASGRRIDRVLAIAHHPLVHRHLRVCWQNVADRTNCGRCEKCLRTMVMLAGADQLRHCRTFPHGDDLPSVLDGLDHLPGGTVPMWTDLDELELSPPLRRAVDDLVARSR